MLSILDLKIFWMNNLLQNSIFHLKCGDLRLADGYTFTRWKHQLGRNSTIDSGLWPRQMFSFLFRQSSSRSRAFSIPGMMGNILFWNNIHREFKEKKNVIDTHRFAAYILLYLFSTGFRGTSLFTNEPMLFVTYPVSPVSILQKSDKHPRETRV